MIRAWLVALGILAASVGTFAQETRTFVPYDDPAFKRTFEIPQKYELVNDFVGGLTLVRRVALRDKLRELERVNGTQIVILIIPSTGGEGLQKYTDRVLEKWNIGNNGQANGVLLAVEANGQYFLRTGVGISGALPDSRIRQILRDRFEPAWQQEQDWDNWGKAIEGAIDAMIKVARGEETEPTFYDYDSKPSKFRLEYLGVALLSVCGLVYFWFAVWRPHRKTRRRGQE